MNLLAVLSFPMTGPSFHRTVDLLRQSLALETQFIILVSKFLEKTTLVHETLQTSKFQLRNKGSTVGKEV